jgi:hypothetical protein
MLEADEAGVIDGEREETLVPLAESSRGLVRDAEFMAVEDQ